MHLAAGQLQRRLQRIRQAGCATSSFTTIRSTTTSMVCFLFFSSSIFSRQLAQLAVHAHPHKTLLLNVGKKLGMLAFAARNDRRQNLQPRPFRIFHNAVDHLLDGLRRNLDAMIRAMRLARPARTATANNRRFPLPYRRWNAGCGSSSSGRWKSPATTLRWNRHPASPSVRETGAHRPTSDSTYRRCPSA